MLWSNFVKRARHRFKLGPRTLPWESLGRTWIQQMIHTHSQWNVSEIAQLIAERQLVLTWKQGSHRLQFENLELIVLSHAMKRSRRCIDEST
jgi:hypothetical protein